MSVTTKTVRHVAHLSRIALNEEQIIPMTKALNAILGFVEQLNEIDITAIEPMVSSIPTTMKKRPDCITEGNIPSSIVANAPVAEENFFLVPKMVE